MAAGADRWGVTDRSAAGGKACGGLVVLRRIARDRAPADLAAAKDFFTKAHQQSPNSMRAGKERLRSSAGG